MVGRRGRSGSGMLRRRHQSVNDDEGFVPRQFWWRSPAARHYVLPFCGKKSLGRCPVPPHVNANHGACILRDRRVLAHKTRDARVVVCAFAESLGKMGGVRWSLEMEAGNDRDHGTQLEGSPVAESVEIRAHSIRKLDALLTRAHHSNDRTNQMSREARAGGKLDDIRA